MRCRRHSTSWRTGEGLVARGAGSKSGGALAGHHNLLPLARSLVQDSVTVIWHLPNRGVLSPVKLIAPQCYKAETQSALCWGC